MVVHEQENPYMYCGDCKILCPMVIIKGKKSCAVCGKQGLEKFGLPVIMLTKVEAQLRRLPVTEKDD